MRRYVAPAFLAMAVLSFVFAALLPLFAHGAPDARRRSTFSSGPSAPPVVFHSIMTSQVPVNTDRNVGGITVGLKFQVTAPLKAYAMRYWRLAGDTVAHTGALYELSDATTTPTATLLTSGTADAQAAAGTWSRVDFATTVDLTPGKYYLVVNYSPAGYFCNTQDVMSAGITNGPVRAMPHPGTGNGVYILGSGLQVPHLTPGGSGPNYFVDIIAGTG